MSKARQRGPKALHYGIAMRRCEYIETWLDLVNAGARSFNFQTASGDGEYLAQVRICLRCVFIGTIYYINPCQKQYKWSL